GGSCSIGAGKVETNAAASSSGCGSKASTVEACATIAPVLLEGLDLYRVVVQERMAHARESVWISTANVKAMMIEREGRFRPVADLFSELTGRGVEVRVLHAELPSRPFRAAFDAKALLAKRMTLKICPRVHFKCVLVDGAW